MLVTPMGAKTKNPDGSHHTNDCGGRYPHTTSPRTTNVTTTSVSRCHGTQNAENKSCNNNNNNSSSRGLSLPTRLSRFAAWTSRKGGSNGDANGDASTEVYTVHIKLKVLHRQNTPYCSSAGRLSAALLLTSTKSDGHLVEVRQNPKKRPTPAKQRESPVSSQAQQHSAEILN